MEKRKVVLVGTGFVGMSFAYALFNQGGANELVLIDVLKDDRKSLDDEVYLRENIALVSKYLAKLNKREKEIIVKRYGLNNRKEMTQKDIAKELKISRSYVSRIEKRAISKILKDFIKNKKIQ